MPALEVLQDFCARIGEVALEKVFNNPSQALSYLKQNPVFDTVHTSTLYAAHDVNPTRNASDHVFGNSATDLANEY